MKNYLIFLFLLVPYTISAQTEQNALKIQQLINEKNGTENDSIKVFKLLEISELLPEDSEHRLTYMVEGLEIAHKNKMREEMGVFYYDMAWYYFYINDKDNTIINFLRAVEFSTNDEILVFSYGCLSNNSSWDGDHEQALKYADKAYEIANNNPDKSLKADALMFLGDVYSYQGKSTRAKVYYLQSFDNLRFVSKTPRSMLYVVLNMYLGDTTWTKQYTIFRYGMMLKQMYEESSPRKKRVLVYYIIKAANASVSTTENVEVQTIELQNQRKQLILYAISILFLIIIAVLLVIQVHVKKKANEKLAKANEIKSQMFVILNHDLRQPIASLIGYLNLKLTNPEAMTAEEAQAFDQQTVKTANNVLTSMENLLIWAKEQMHAFEIDLQPVSIEKIFEDVQAFFSYEDQEILKFETSGNIVLKTDRNYLNTIMRNLTLNAIAASKNTPNPEVVWKARKEKKKIILTIQNSGKKINQDKIDILYNDSKSKLSSNGTGLIIAKSLAKSINCKIEVETGDVYGTTFHLIFTK